MSLTPRNAHASPGNPGRRPFRWLCLLLLALAGASPALASDSLMFSGMAQIKSTVGAITLAAPAGLVLAPSGTTFIADTANGRIVKITPQGTATVLTLSGLATALAGPTALALDASGNLYIADTGNSRVVKVASGGTASVIDTGSVILASPRGVAVDGSGNLFIADTGNNQIVEVTSAGSAATLALAVSGSPSTLASPRGLAVSNAGVLYIADAGNNRIVTVASGSTTGVVQSLAWSAVTTALSGPSAVALDQVGNLFIADPGNNRMVVVDKATTARDLNADAWGPAMSAPAAVAVDIQGTVHIADTGNNRVLAETMPLVADADTTVYASSMNRTAVNFGHVTLGSASPVTLLLPVVLPATPAFGAVRVFTTGVENLDFTLGTTSPLASGATGSVLVEVKFLPTAPGLRTGAVVLYDSSSNAIMTIPLVAFADAPVAALSPNLATVIATDTLATTNPYQVALDGSGTIYCGTYSSKLVARIAAGGGTAAAVALGTPESKAVQNITGVALDGAGNLFIGDHQNSRILVVTPSGVVSVLSLIGLSPVLGFPTALAFDGAGDLHIADFTTGRIVRVSNLKVTGSTASGLATVLPTGGYTFSGSTVTGMTIDPFGAYYIAARTQNNSSIIKITAAGAGSVLSLPGISILNPQGVASDAFGNIYVVDTGHRQIVKLTTSGEAAILTLSSSTITLGATLFGVTADPVGNLYISDWANNRLVYVDVSGAAMAYASTNKGSTSTDSPRTATVTNLGNQPLVFPADPAYTADFSWNAADTNPITSATTLAAGATGNVSVSFTPQSIGSLSAGITVFDNHLNAASATQQVSVSGTGLNPGDTTATTVTLSPASLVSGAPLAITATVADTTSGNTATLPTGTVTFTDTVGSVTTDLGSATLSGGQALVSGVVLTGIGTHTIAASYTGVTDTFLASSGSASVDLAKAPVTLLGPATTAAALFDTATFTATATGPYTTIAPPSGAFTWSILDASSASVASGTATLAAGSSASSASWSVSAATLGVGTYTVSFTYGGDGNYLPVTTPATCSLVISKAAPALGLVSSANPVLGLAPVTFTATASGTGGIPTGAITFYDGTALLGSATLASGNAALTTSALAPGTHAITAVYGGDGSFTGVTSAAVSQVVQQLTSTVALGSSSSTGSDPFGISVTYTATVANAGGITPTGSVTFLDGTTALATVSLSGGRATFTTSTLAQGAHSITAAYAGDGADLSSVSPAVTETVTAPVVVVPTPAASVTVADGGTATTQFTLASLGTLGAPVTFAVSGLPAGATCTFGSTSVAATATPVVVTATLTTTPRLQILGQVQDSLPLGGFGGGALLLGGLFLIPSRRRKRMAIALSALALALVGGLMACGGGTSSAKGITTGTSGTPAGTYAITITASSQGAVQATSTFTLTVN